MKRIIFVLTLFVAINCFGQSKTPSSQTENKTDSITRDTKFLSINDIYRIYETFSDKITVSQGRTFDGIMQAILNAAIQEYYEKQKSLPKK